MRTVYKYPVDIIDHQCFEINKEAETDTRIVHVGLDPQGTPCVWVELTPGQYVEQLAITIVGTGNQIPGAKSHVGSFVDGPFVWHVYA